MQVHKWSSWDFLSLLNLQKIKEDNVSQLGNNDEIFNQQQHMHGSCCISFFKFKSFDQLIPPPPPNCLKFQTFTQLWHYIDQFKNRQIHLTDPRKYQKWINSCYVLKKYCSGNESFTITLTDLWYFFHEMF